ncbi:MAG: hypothetical protein Q8R13_05605 [bacterium]|nr:hypothetical protein [bacterium]MDZ4296470.1 hypothetical protein [Patescibacteria group bacterium]
MGKPTAVFGELDPSEILGIIQEPRSIPCWIYRRNGEERRQEPPLTPQERTQLLGRWVLRRRYAHEMKDRIEAATHISFAFVIEGSTDMWLKALPESA